MGTQMDSQVPRYLVCDRYISELSIMDARRPGTDRYTTVT